MYILVLYYSRSGNTKALAGAIADGVREVEGVDCLLRSCDEVTRDEFAGAAGVIAGSPVYFGTMAAQLKSVLDEFVGARKKMENTIGAAFATSADASGGKETTILSILQAMLIYGMIVVGDPLKATGHYGVSCQGKPDAKAANNGALMGRRVAELALKVAAE